MIDPQAPDFTDTPAAPSRPGYTYRPREPRGEDPQVSIVTVVDDVSTGLDETVRCVLGQSLQGWEWLIVAEASVGSEGRAALARCPDLDRRIRVIDGPACRGHGAARNAGCLAARAPYLFVLPAGDLLEPLAIEQCLWRLTTDPGAAFTGGWSVRLGPSPALCPTGYEAHEKFLDDNLAAPAFLVRRRAHEAVGGFDESLEPGLEDWDYWLRHAERGVWGATIPAYLSWHRGRGEAGVDRERVFRHGRPMRYPRISGGGFPRMSPRTVEPYETVPVERVVDNPLKKPAGVRRVLLIFPRFIVGGADKFAIDAIEQLVARGHEVTVGTTLEDDNPWLPRVTRLTPDVFRLATFLRLPDYPRFLLYLIDSRAIDVVIVSHCYLGYQLLPFLRAHRPGVACVDYSHIEAEHWNNGGYPRAAVACQELTDLTLVSTRHLRDWMVGRGARAERIEVVHTNIDTDLWQPDPAVAAAVRAELGIARDVTVILYACRLTARKQPHVFAEVVRRLAADARLDFVCLVAGEGDELPALQQFLDEHGLASRVCLLGFVSTERMRALQAAADVCFLPSRLEGLALALFEAMAMETVPVAARVGGQDELVTADCGVLVAPGDEEIERYVDALRRLIASPSLRSAMGSASRRRVVESFRIEAMGAALCEALTRAEKLCLTEPRPPVSRGLGLESAVLAVEQFRKEAAYVYHLACANAELTARVDDLHRRLTSAHLEVGRVAGGEAVRRLSARDLSRHLGARTIVKALGLRLWRRLNRAADERRPMSDPHG